MYDIKGSNDLELDVNGDLILEKTPGSLFEKAVITPQGYISIEYSPNKYVDQQYGNGVYYKIKENIDSGILSDINKDVKDAISYVNIPIDSVSSYIDSLMTINYTLTYKDNTTQGITINV